MTSERVPLIIHHANCADGMTAAWLLHCRYISQCELMPVQYGDDPPAPERLHGREVWVVDFSYPRAVLMGMHAASRKLQVLDHHQTAEAELRGLSFCRFAQNKSGARMVWEYLINECVWEPSPNTVGPIEMYDGVATVDSVPWLVAYTEDRDLWRWELDDSREVNAAIQLRPYTVEAWQEMADEELPHTMAAQGKTILRYQQTVVEKHVAGAHLANIGGQEVPCVNATTLVSEIGHALCQGEPFAAMYFETGGKRVYSLRSDEQGLDVSVIAKRYGGGGHQHAAGFTCAAQEIEP